MRLKFFRPSSDLLGSVMRGQVMKKISIYVVLGAFFSILIFNFQNCSKASFSMLNTNTEASTDVALAGAPISASSRKIKFDADSDEFLDQNTFKVIFIIDNSKSLDDNLANLYRSVDKMVDVVAKYNVKFYVYSSNSTVSFDQSGTSFKRFIFDKNSVIANEIPTVFKFADGSTKSADFSQNNSIGDWVEAKYELNLKPDLAEQQGLDLRVQKNASLDDLKSNLKKLLTVNQSMIDNSSNIAESPLCTLSRILNDNGQFNPLKPNDKVSFVIATDEADRGMIGQLYQGGFTTSKCNRAGTLTRKAVTVAGGSKWCMDHGKQAAWTTLPGQIAPACPQDFLTTAVGAAYSLIAPLLSRSISGTLPSADIVLSGSLDAKVLFYNQSQVSKNTNGSWKYPALPVAENCTQAEQDALFRKLTHKVVDPTQVDRSKLICRVVYSQRVGDAGEIYKALKSSTNAALNTIAEEMIQGPNACIADAVVYNSWLKIRYANFKEAFANDPTWTGAQADNALATGTCRKYYIIPETISGPVVHSMALVPESPVNTGKQMVTDPKLLSNFVRDAFIKRANELLGAKNYSLAAYFNQANEKMCTGSVDEIVTSPILNALVDTMGHEQAFKDSICAADFDSHLSKIVERIRREVLKTFAYSIAEDEYVQAVHVNGEKVPLEKFVLEDEHITFLEGFIKDDDVIELIIDKK